MTSPERPPGCRTERAADGGGGPGARHEHVEAIAEEFADIYSPKYLEDLRGEWPE